MKHKTRPSVFHYHIIFEGQVALSNDKQEKNAYLQAELFIALRGILNETSAYRKYFATVEDLKNLFQN